MSNSPPNNSNTEEEQQQEKQQQIEFLKSMFQQNESSIHLEDEIIEMILEQKEYDLAEALESLLEILNQNSQPATPVANVVDASELERMLMEELEIKLRLEEEQEQEKPKTEEEEKVEQLQDIFPQLDKDVLEAQLIAADYDLMVAYEQVALLTGTYVDKIPKKKPKKGKFVKRDDLLGAKQGLIRSQWTTNPQQTAKLANQLKLEKLKSWYGSACGSPQRVEQIFNNFGCDFVKTFNSLQQQYPHVNVSTMNHATSTIATSSSWNQSSSKSFSSNIPVVASGLNSQLPLNALSSRSKSPTVVRALSEEEEEQKYIIFEQQSSKLLSDPLERRRIEKLVEGRIEIDPQLNNYEAYRKKAQELMKLRNEYFQKALQYFVKGDGKAAGEYADKGKELNVLIEEWNDLASNQIFEEQNSKFNGQYTIDLHGLHVEEAIAAVKQQLEKIESRNRSGNKIKYFTIITGKGLHSQLGKAKIKPAIEKLLKERQYNFYTAPSNGYITVNFL